MDPNANCNYDLPGYLCTLKTCCLAQSSFLYRPTLGGNTFFAVLFGLLIFAQIAFGIRYRTWGYMSAMILGLLSEVIGYVGRIMLYFNPFNGIGFWMYVACHSMEPNLQS